MSTKLTKKQKKAAAFRGKKGGGGREEPQDVPTMDDPAADDGFGQNAVAPLKTNAAKSSEASTTAPSKKRKREDDTLENNELPSKKVKLPVTNEDGISKPKEKKQTAAPRYILFVGNLSYKTTTEAIAQHFSACDPPPTIRQLTSRSKGSNMAPEKSERSKGCAFLEFSKASGLQNALRLHHSELDGRQINVELSAGGGGKSEARMKKLKTKNAKLDKHRVDSMNKEKGQQVDDEPEQWSLKPAKTRHSSTSGTKTVPRHKATWSVPKPGETTGRGGQKHRRGSNTDKSQGGRGRRPNNDWTMSGANAIPVG